MSFIIDPSSVSFEDLRQDVRDYLEAAPDALKWKDFFASGVGQTTIALIAA